MAKLQLKRLVGRGCSWLPRPARRDIVLLYHSVGRSPWAVPAERFREQMDWLQQAAAVVPLEAVFDRGSAAGLRAAVTFDDGYASLFGAAAPIASKFGIRPAVFLNTDLVQEERRTRSRIEDGHYPDEEFLLWREVAQLATAGWTVGSHGAMHIDLKAAADDVARRQLQDSKTAIERMLHLPCRHFAYTWGHHSSRLRALVAKAGYECAFAGTHGPVDPLGERFAVPRINIAADYSFDDFRSVVLGHWDYLGVVQRFRNAVRA